MSQGPIRLGPLLLTRPIGRGGMGTVWHARHPEGVDVAVKVVRPEYAAQPEQAEAFRREVRSVAFLDHPGIVRVFDFGVVPEPVAEASADRLPARALWLSMEFAEGGTLGDLPQLPTWDALHDVLQQILRALAHGHARGIVHRDLKPRNVLVHPLPDGMTRVSLTDYGIAHALHRESSDRAQAGTPGYMAPEQIRGDWRDLGPPTDLYSLGSLAWRLATGRSPFPGDRAPAVLFAQLSGRMRNFEPAIDVPRGFEEWVARLLQVDATQRFRCAADAAAELTAIHRGEPRSNGATGRLQALREPRAPDEETTTARPRGTGLALFVYRPWPLVGRQRVLDELWTTFRSVATSGRAQVIVLSGHAGVGKTRLATWLAERVEELGAAWTLRPPPERNSLAGRTGGTGGFSRPGVALPNAVRRLLRLEELPAEQIHMRLAQALADRGSAAPEVDATAFQALLDQAFVLGQLAAHTLTPNDEANRGWMALFDRLAHDRPLVVIVENLHAEPQAVGLLEALIGTRRPVLAIGTLDRTAHPVPSPPVRRLCERAKTIDVEALDAVLHRRMIDAGVGLSPRLAEQVVERSRGDLSLTVRLVSDWVRRSLLVPTSDGFDLREGADPRLSDGLCDELAARLEGLGAARIEVLTLLAALGPRRVRGDEWAAVCEAKKRPLRADTLAALVGRGLLTAEGGLDGPRYTLVPPALREVILHRAAEQEQLAAVHQICAGVLVSLPRASAHERAIVHFSEAGLPEVGLHHLRELVDRMVAEAQWRRIPPLLAYERELLDRLEVPQRDPRRFRNQLDALVVDEGAGKGLDVERARGLLNRAAESGDVATAARLAALILRREARAGTLRPDDVLLKQARRWATDAGDNAALVSLVRMGGEAAWRRLDLPLADRLLTEAADLAKGAEERIALLALLGEVRGLSGSTEQASVLVGRALELALRSGSRAGLARALIAQAILARRRGDAAGALDLAHRAVNDLSALGHDPEPAELQVALASIAVGQPSAARRLLKRLVASEDPDRQVVATAGLLACAAVEPREAGFDQALAEWRALADADRGYHPDTVWPLEWAAGRAVEDGAVDRAQILLRLAEDRYHHLRDPGAAERVQRERKAIGASLR